MIGWKYWNKNRPADETNRPHAMRKSGIKPTHEAKQTNEEAALVENSEPSDETQPQFVVPKSVPTRNKPDDETQFVLPKSVPTGNKPTDETQPQFVVPNSVPTGNKLAVEADSQFVVPKPVSPSNKIRTAVIKTEAEPLVQEIKIKPVQGQSEKVKTEPVLEVVKEGRKSGRLAARIKIESGKDIREGNALQAKSAS